MRRAATILLGLMTVAGAGCGSDDPETVRGGGYQFEVPDGWDDRSGDAGVAQLDFAGYTPDTVVMAEVEEGFATNVNVLVEGSIAPGVSAREYADAADRLLREPELLRGEARRLITELNARDFSAPRHVELDGEDASARDYTGEVGGRVLRFRNVVAVRGSRAYGITYTALRHRFRAHADEADQVFETWTWR